MDYRTWNDAELRCAVNAEPDNLNFVYAASDRFRNQFSFDMPKDVGDVCSGFPDEDFVSDVLDRLRRLADGLKGPSGTECLGIIADLQNIEQEVANNVEYGREELRKVEDALATYAEANS